MCGMRAASANFSAWTWYEAGIRAGGQVTHAAVLMGGC